MTMLADMTETTIDVGRDFSAYPAGRVREDGPNSAERFRDDILVPALEANDHVAVILDTAKGFGSSFFDECFGQIVRSGQFTAAVLREKLRLIAEKDSHKPFIDDIWYAVDFAANQVRALRA